MKKKIIVGILLIFTIALTSVVAYAVNAGIMSQKATPSDYKIGIPYDKAINENKPIVALFYADWCGYCLRFMPRYKTLESLYKTKYNFVMINIEDPKMLAVVKDADLTGYPTVYIIDPKYDNKLLLNNAIYLDLAKFRKELDRYLKIRTKLEKAEVCK